LEAFGLADEIADIPAEDEYEATEYPVWRDNFKALNVFLALATQWEFVVLDGHLIRTRLIYEAIETVLRNTNGIGKRDWAGIIEDLRHMESAALEAFNQERAKRLEEEQRNRAWRD